MPSNINSGEWSWIKSLLLKNAILGVGVVFVMWVGWFQPQLRPTDGSSFPTPSSELPNTFGEDVKKDNLQTIPSRLLVDLNLSSRIELQALPGIGVTLAERIVAYRSNHGDFQDVDDLVKVPGIGKKRLKKLEPYVKVTERKNVS